MAKEVFHTKELERQHINAYKHIFIPRQDMFPIQTPGGSYATIKEGLNFHHLVQHLTGQMTLGAYAPDIDSQAQWICLDADIDETWHGLRELSSRLAKSDIPVYRDLSRRGHIDYDGYNRRFEQNERETAHWESYTTKSQKLTMEFAMA